MTTGIVGGAGNAVAAYNAALKLAKTAVDTTKGAEKASLQAVEGTADLQQVVNAVTAAELTVQTVTAVRDRVISAYQEVLRMPI